MSHGVTVTNPSEYSLVGEDVDIETKMDEVREHFFEQSVVMWAKFDELEVQVNWLTDENTKLKKDINELNIDNDSKRQKIDALEIIIFEMKTAYEKWGKEMETFKKQIDTLRIEIKEEIPGITSKEKENIFTEKIEALVKRSETLASEHNDVRQRLEDLEDKSSLKRKIYSTQQENHDQLKDAKKLRQDYDDTRDRPECKKSRLVLGKVACLLEAEIWENVLPEKRRGKTQILDSMERWLSNKSDKKEHELRKAASERWEELKRKLEWKDEKHKPAMKILKDLGAADADTDDVDLEEAKRQLNDYVSDVDKESCQELIEMMATVKKFNAAANQ